VTLLLLLPGYLPAQEKKSGKESKEILTFRLPVDVIVVNVTATDKQGHPVKDLQKNDFAIYEDGKPQPVQTFELESYESIQTEITPGKSGPEPNAATVSNAARPRMISLVVDDSTITSYEYYPAVAKAMTRFVEQNMGPSDQVAILAGSGSVQFPFTDNESILLEEIRALFKKLGVPPPAKCPQLTDLHAKRILDEQDIDSLLGPSMQRVQQRLARMFQQNPGLASMSSDEFLILLDQELNKDEGLPKEQIETLLGDVSETIDCMGMFNSVNSTNPLDVIRRATNITRDAASRQLQESEYHIRDLLRTLQQHIRTLRHFDALKNVILFSNGFWVDNSAFLSSALQDVVDQALLSGVLLNTVDIRGLIGAITSQSAGGEFRDLKPEAISRKQLLIAEEQIAQEAPLSRMANDTGGAFHHNNNDMYEGLRNAVQRRSSYYVLTYTKPQQKSNGDYHHIKVVVSRNGTDLSYRKGYYAPREELTFERRKKEDILEALSAPDNINEIAIDLSYNYYQEDDVRYTLTLSTHIDIHRMRFLEEDSRQKNLINLVVVAYDEMDHYVDGLEKSIDFKLTDSNYASLLDRGINSKVTFHMPLGRYRIKAIVREGSQGKMGSITKSIEIP
jgi:VWFA-related protein